MDPSAKPIFPATPNQTVSAVLQLTISLPRNVTNAYFRQTVSNAFLTTLQTVFHAKEGFICWETTVSSAPKIVKNATHLIYVSNANQDTSTQQHLTLPNVSLVHKIAKHVSNQLQIASHA